MWDPQKVSQDPKLEFTIRTKKKDLVPHMTL